MPGRVKLDPPTPDVVGVQFRGQHALLVRQRSGEHPPERRYDETPSADENPIRFVAEPIVHAVRKVGAREVLAGGEYKAAALQGDMRHAGRPGVAVVNSGRAVESEVLCV